MKPYHILIFSCVLFLFCCSSAKAERQAAKPLSGAIFLKPDPVVKVAAIEFKGPIPLIDMPTMVFQGPIPVIDMPTIVYDRTIIVELKDQFKLDVNSENFRRLFNFNRVGEDNQGRLNFSENEELRKPGGIKGLFNFAKVGKVGPLTRPGGIKGKIGFNDNPIISPNRDHKDSSELFIALIVKMIEETELSDASVIAQTATTSLEGNNRKTAPPKLIPTIGKKVLSATPIVLKFEHDVRQTGFSYEFEKWDNKRKRWNKTKEPKLLRSETSDGEERVVTSAKFRIRAAGKYRWTLAGYKSLKPMEFEVIARRSIHGIKGAPKVKKAFSIWFDLSTKPKPKPKVNEAFNLVIGAKNIGNAKNSSADKVTIKIDCKPIDGGKCVKSKSSYTVETINPGSKKTISIPLKVTRGGKYRVTMTLDPQPISTHIALPGLLKKSHIFYFKVDKATQKTTKKDSRPSGTGHPGSSRPPAGSSSSGGSTLHRQRPPGITP